MLDINLLRSDITSVSTKLAKRGMVLDVEYFEQLDAKRKMLQVQTQTLQQQRNQIAKLVGQAKAKGEPVEEIMSNVSRVNEELKIAQEKLSSCQAELDDWLIHLPNIPDDDVPVGKDESENKVIHSHLKPTAFDFEVLDHVSLTEGRGLDFESATKLSGSRFVVMRGEVARLHRALAQWMLDLHVTKHGYEEINVPLLVLPEMLRGTGQLPKFADDQFQTTDDRGLYLIPTAEVPLTNLVREQIFSEEDLPKKFVAHTPCFRQEAGSYGKDTRGMFRQHQFEKVELVQIVHPEQSDAALEALVTDAQAVLKGLELPYQVMSLCTGDIGFTAAKTYDLEVWLPSQNTYREISSCSNTRAFQARRMQTRVRLANKDIVPVHTLNGSGVAIGRCLIAILENYQLSDRSIAVPTVLKPYLNNASTLNI